MRYSLVETRLVEARLNMRTHETHFDTRNISLEKRWSTYAQKYQLSLSWGTPVIVSITVITFLFIVSRALAS